MAEVQSLRVAPRPVSKDVIELLEAALVRAQAGEVVSVAVVEVRPAGTVATSWFNSNHYHGLNSGCARLAAQLANVPSDG